MNKYYAHSFWRQLVGLTFGCPPSCQTLLTDPLVSQTLTPGSGSSGTMDAPEGSIEESALFGDEISLSANELFRRAVRNTPLSEGERERIAVILSNASSRIDYTKHHADCSVQPDSLDSADHSGETPVSIYNYLDQTVIGHDEAKKQAALIVYNTLKGRKRNALFAGPTGCGKSEIWRTLAKKFSFIRLFDATSLAADGWKGSLHWRDVFGAFPENEREHAIIVLDEADKMLEPAIGSGGTDMSRLVQNTLLKIMDGDTLLFGDDGDLKINSFEVSTASVSIVLLGSFETLFVHKKAAETVKPFGFQPVSAFRPAAPESTITSDDLITYGNMRREIAGRIHSVTLLDPMQESDYRNLLNDPERSPVARLSGQYGVSLSISDELKDRLCHDAAESGLGCRFILSELQKRLDQALFGDCSATAFHL